MTQVHLLQPAAKVISQFSCCTITSSQSTCRHCEEEMIKLTINTGFE